MVKFVLIVAALYACIISSSAKVPLTEYLMPVPKHISCNEGNLGIVKGRMLISPEIKDARITNLARKVKQQLSDIGISCELTHQLANGEKPLLELAILNKKDAPTQGYKIDIDASGIRLTGNDVKGLNNGIKTLEQIIDYAKQFGAIPQLHIEDHPDYTNRGIMLDISRDKVPTLTTLFKYIDQFASWKINQVQLYTEHTFAYQNHEKVWKGYSPYTAEDIIAIDAYCHANFIELIANQNSLGHMEKWFDHKEYQHLAELVHVVPNGERHERKRTTFNPVDPGSLELVNGLYDELLPNFRSKSVNIGGDEPWELGYGRSKEECDKHGKSEVYLSYMSEITQTLNDKGYEPQMWADIILNYPKDLHRLPDNITCMVWGYRYWYPFDKNCEKMKKAGVPFYVCPGTSSWRSFIGRLPNALENQQKAAIAGKQHGAIGYLNTDWGDHGHWQPYAISYPPLMYGAALSWSVNENMELNIEQAVANHAIESGNKEIAHQLIELGHVYKLYDEDLRRYVNTFYEMLLQPDSLLTTERFAHVNLKKTHKVIDKLTTIIKVLENCNKYNQEDELLAKELMVAAQFAKHTALQAKARLTLHDNKISKASDKVKYDLQSDLKSILHDYQLLWLERNRPGGLQQSLEKFKPVMDAYTIN
ncbi:MULTISPECIES: beta-N-acetylhexosaminidase [unclassified Carboxylicivirga]|uniref:beta-N-acetylhexosaminidase n=1 Tax=Carboxylicivirga TaxID=1628153 RepID=UPI003D328168